MPLKPKKSRPGFHPIEIPLPEGRKPTKEEMDHADQSIRARLKINFPDVHKLLSSGKNK